MVESSLVDVLSLFSVEDGVGDGVALLLGLGASEDEPGAALEDAGTWLLGAGEDACDCEDEAGTGVELAAWLDDEEDESSPPPNQSKRPACT